MITPVCTDPSLTLGFEKTESGFPRFRIEFRPEPGFWLDSQWFVPSSARPETVRLIYDLSQAKAAWDAALNAARLGVREYFEDFNKRIPTRDHISYRDGSRPLTELEPLDAAYVEWGQRMGRLKDVLGDMIRIEDLCVLRPRNSTGHSGFFAYRRGVVWHSPMDLKPDQWVAMIDAESVQRGLTSAVPNTAEGGDENNRSIAVAVRREVWRRDQGKCVVCGSQQRLEFDHVIPVAVGGSNTVRNIQLLCERCNRQKSATLG